MPSLIRPRSEILPDRVLCPGALWLTHGLPMLLLLLASGGIFWLLFSELELAQRMQWGALIGFLILQLAFTATVFRKARRNDALVPLSQVQILMAANILYLGFMSAWTVGGEGLISDAEARWILDDWQLLGLQFTLMMPALFHNTLRVACWPCQLRGMNDLIASLLAGVLIPVGAFLLMVLFRFIGSFFGGMMLVFFFGLTLLAMLCILRALSLLYVMAVHSPQGQGILLMLFSLILPLAGLALNRAIPFPADYQQPEVYLLTVLTTVALVGGRIVRPFPGQFFFWVLQWAVLPFTLYFFLVFLPWLPLSLFAMIAMGAGFLILAPTALFLVHGFSLTHSFQRLYPRFGKGVLFGTALLGLFLMPVGLGIQAWQDRVMLNQAIAYVFEPSAQRAEPFTLEASRVRRSLNHLNDHYRGRYVPYLSNFYDMLVFQGLVLPTPKLEILYASLLGETPPEVEGSMWGASTRSRGNWRTIGRPPPATGALLSVHWQVTEREGVVEATATLQIHNPGDRQVEFVEEIELPAGCWVTGYWLEVEGVRKPGRITERKTANWIYQMIRDATRRDPGLLVIQGPDTVELRVFPLEPGQTRITGITFTLIPQPEIGLAIGPHAMPQVAAPVLSGYPAQGALGLVTSSGIDPFMAIQRRPMLYVMLDRSAQGPEDVSTAVAVALESGLAEAKVPVAGLRMVDVNFRTLVYPEVILDPEQARQVNPILLREGGVLVEHALVQMFEDHQALCRADPKWATTYPLPIWVLGEGEPVVTGRSLDPWLAGVPEWQGIQDSEKPLWEWRPVPRPVWIFQSGQQVAAVDIVRSFATLWDMDASVGLSIWDDLSETFISMDRELSTPVPPAYQAYVSTWQAYRSYWQTGEPSLREVVRLSRESGVLLPVTAYLVLENAAQEKMARLKEQQKLSGEDALDFLNTPEPDALLIWLTVGLLAIWHHRSQALR